MIKETPNKIYIGDGVYLSNDGWHLILETERDGRIESIYLGSQMVKRLLEYGIEVGLLDTDLGLSK